MEILKLLWSSSVSVVELQVTFSGTSPLFLCVGTCHHVLASRCLYSASNGYTRLTLSDMQVGDVACVILGCGHPVVVRPVHGVGSQSLWRVVGSAIVPGFMSGEVIYGGQLLAKYQLIDLVIDGIQYRYIRANIIREGHESALYNTINKRSVDNPAVVLEDAGVKVDDYCRNVELIVFPGSLRTSGVALREFAII
jgi:hypothetical protein